MDCALYGSSGPNAAELLRKPTQWGRQALAAGRLGVCGQKRQINTIEYLYFSENSVFWRAEMSQH